MTEPAPKAVRAPRRVKPIRPHVATGHDAIVAEAQEIDREIEQSVFAQMIIRRSRAEAEKAKNALATVSPFDHQTIMVLQNEILRHDQIAGWIMQTRQEGEAALQALEAQFGIEYADGDPPEA